MDMCDGIEWICVASFVCVRGHKGNWIWMGLNGYVLLVSYTRLEDLLRQLPLCYVLFCR